MTTSLSHKYSDNHSVIFYIFLLNTRLNVLLTFQIRYLRIDGDNRIGKLEQISQRVYKTVLTDNDMTQAPVSNQPLQSPQSRIAAPEVWSNKLFSTIVLRGVLNKEPRARLLRITLPENKTSGVHVRFSIPKPLCSLITWSTGPET